MLIEYPARCTHDAYGSVLVQFVDLEDTFTSGDTEEDALFNAAEVLTGMHRRLICCIILGILLMASATARADLIVMAAPLHDDAYYAGKIDAIVQFHIDFASSLSEGDQALVLTDSTLSKDYVSALGQDAVLTAAMLDIWIRDFAAVNPDNPLLFRYTAAGQGGGAQGQAAADAVQQRFLQLAEAAGLEFAQTTLLNDGGNFVEDGQGQAILSRKFLRDNSLSETQARKALQALSSAEHIAFIESDEQGGLEHADGVVMFAGPNTVLANEYPDAPAFAAHLQSYLRTGLPDASIHELANAYTPGDVHDPRFGSACGLYVNAVVTENAIYVPQFGYPDDAAALEQIRQAATLPVVPVAASGVCAMGGSVRCLTWQVRGDNAKKLLRYARAQRAHNSGPVSVLLEK